MSRRLDDKCVLVTGGGSGIGKAVSQLFSKEGANVAIVDVDQSNANQVLRSLEQGRHCVVIADVTKSDDVKKAFATVEKFFGRKCDIVVNNAGITNQRNVVSDLDEGEFDRVIEVNLKGVFLVAKEFLNSVKTVNKDVRGVLINTSSAYARLSPAGNADYSSSKAGVVAITKTIANEFSVHNVRCNAVMPGAVQTPLLATVSEENLEIMRQTIPMKRFADPMEVAYGFLYLASEESSYVHGVCLEINGGI